MLFNPFKIRLFRNDLSDRDHHRRCTFCRWMDAPWSTFNCIHICEHIYRLAIIQQWNTFTFTMQRRFGIVAYSIVNLWHDDDDEEDVPPLTWFTFNHAHRRRCWRSTTLTDLLELLVVFTFSGEVSSSPVRGPDPTLRRSPLLRLHGRLLQRPVQPRPVLLKPTSLPALVLL